MNDWVAAIRSLRGFPLTAKNVSNEVCIVPNWMCILTVTPLCLLMCNSKYGG